MQGIKPRLLVVLAAALALSGCTIATTYLPLPQSNFAYPNSNVIPLKHAEGTASRSYVQVIGFVMTPDLGAGAVEQEAINNALQSSGGDLLVDGTYTMKATVYPLDIINIYTVDVTVEGTAAKMELGRRKLQ